MEGGKRRHTRRTGPCDHCCKQESTQWRVGPPNAPTLCNACGVCWGRKKRLPLLPGADAEAPADATPACPPSPVRPEAARAPRCDAQSTLAADRDVAVLLLSLSSATSGHSGDDGSTLGFSRRRAPHSRLKRPESDAPSGAWVRDRRESTTLRSSPGGNASCDAAVTAERPAKRERLLQPAPTTAPADAAHAKLLAPVDDVIALALPPTPNSAHSSAPVPAVSFDATPYAAASWMAALHPALALHYHRAAAVAAVAAAASGADTSTPPSPAEVLTMLPGLAHTMHAIIPAL